MADNPGTITKLGTMRPWLKKVYYYVTLGADLNAFRGIHFTEGNGKASLKSIQQHCENKDVYKALVEQISIDLSRYL
jgi:hypothetical protein